MVLSVLVKSVKNANCFLGVFVFFLPKVMSRLKIKVTMIVDLFTKVKHRLKTAWFVRYFQTSQKRLTICFVAIDHSKIVPKINFRPQIHNETTTIATG